MLDFITFFTAFISTNILTSVLVLLIFTKRSMKECFKKEESIIISLGLGPAINVWFLNILLILFPKMEYFYYLIIPLIVNIVFIILYKKRVREYINYKMLCKFYKNSILYSFFATFIIAVYIILSLYIVKTFTLTGSDMLVYGTEGKIIARDAQIQYKSIYFDDTTKFLYKAHHGYSFALFSSVSEFYNLIFKTSNDLFFRSMSYYYFLLLGVLLFIELKSNLNSNNKRYSILGLTFFLLAPSILVLFYSSSIDSFRLFLLTTTFIIFVKCLKSHQSKPLLFLLGMSLGLSANSHIIGLVASIIFITSLVFLKDKFIRKVIVVTYVSILFTLFGSYHYVLQSFIGDGWITNDKKSGANTKVFEDTSKYTEKYSSKNYDAQLLKKAIYLKEIAKFRGIDTREDLLQNGYLGQFFRYEYFGILNMFWPIILIYLLFNKISRKEKIVLINYLVLIQCYQLLFCSH